MAKHPSRQGDSPARFIEVREDPLPNNMWVIDTFTGKALNFGLCDLHGARKMMNYFNTLPESKVK